MTSEGERDDRGVGEKHSKRAGEPDPGLDPKPYESSSPSPEAVQRSAGEDQLLASLGEGATGDGVEGADVAGGRTSGRDDEHGGDQLDDTLVEQPGQPNMGPPQTAPAPGAPDRD
jgi:hypothetical protein